MSLLDRLARWAQQRSSTSLPPIKVNPPALHWGPPSEKERRDGSTEADDFGVKVVGESNYQSALARITANGLPIIATLIPEDGNPHDAKAVRVDIQQMTVGYLSRDDARAFRTRLARKKLGMVPSTCEAFLTGGHTMRNGAKASHGVELNIKQFDL